MQAVYHPAYAELRLPGHVFPVEKYGLVRRSLLTQRVIAPAAIVAPERLAWDDLARVHEREYLDDLRAARLTPRTARGEIPVEAALIAAFVRMAGGTLTACRAALAEGIATHIGGGFHHAMPGHAEGFCFVNDLACAVAALRHEGRIRRPAVIDCDLHQGNGTAAIFAEDADVFTFSIHEEGIYPVPKARSSLDVPLAAGTGEGTYLEKLAGGLDRALREHDPDFVLYQAGADPYRDDQLGSLQLSRQGLARRDRMVLEAAVRRGIPAAVTLGGGYARRVEDTVGIHVETIRIAAGLAAAIG